MYLPKLPTEFVLYQYSVFFEEKMPKIIKKVDETYITFTNVGARTYMYMYERYERDHVLHSSRVCDNFTRYRDMPTLVGGGWY